MARTKICAELATGHHGDVSVALQMIQAAADAGCDAVKIQHYGAVNVADPQYDWLAKSRLNRSQIQGLRDSAMMLGLEFWATPFDRSSLEALQDLSVTRIKIASSEAHEIWWRGHSCQYVISWPWGDVPDNAPQGLYLAAIPLYPTPLECVGRAVAQCDGWSDHGVGLSACFMAIVNGAQWIEAHLTLGEGKSRVCVWDKHPDDFRKLRQFADDVETMRTGVSQVFRDRWRA
jgi:N,N'-diacetyllegionaminate synthase